MCLQQAAGGSQPTVDSSALGTRDTILVVMGVAVCLVVGATVAAVIVIRRRRGASGGGVKSDKTKVDVVEPLEGEVGDSPQHRQADATGTSPPAPTTPQVHAQPAAQQHRPAAHVGMQRYAVGTPQLQSPPVATAGGWTAPGPMAMQSPGYAMQPGQQPGLMSSAFGLPTSLPAMMAMQQQQQQLQLQLLQQQQQQQLLLQQQQQQQQAHDRDASPKSTRGKVSPPVLSDRRAPKHATKLRSRRKSPRKKSVGGGAAAATAPRPPPSPHRRNIFDDHAADDASSGVWEFTEPQQQDRRRSIVPGWDVASTTS
jgi:hypothetical protein